MLLHLKFKKFQSFEGWKIIKLNVKSMNNSVNFGKHFVNKYIVTIVFYAIWNS